MGAIPKKHSQPPKWCIINDLSWPAGQSVNDAISKELYTRSSDSLNKAISYLKSFGPNALMSKLDAFRHILVDPRDWELLGSTWPIVMPDRSPRTGYVFDMFLPLVSGVPQRSFLGLSTVCDTRWGNVASPPFGTISMIFGLATLLHLLSES